MEFEDLGFSPEEIRSINSQNQEQAILTQPSFAQGKPKDEILGKWEVDFREQITDLIMTLKGFSYDSDNKVYVKNDDLEEEINSKGINTVLAALQVYLSKGIALGNNTKPQIDDIMRSLTTKLGEDFYCNRVAYGIATTSKSYLIQSYVETLALSILNRSLKGWEANNRITMVSISQTQGATNPDGNNKKGFMSRLWGGD